MHRLYIYKGAKLASATSAMALVDFLPRPVSVQVPNPPWNTPKFPASFGTGDLEYRCAPLYIY